MKARLQTVTVAGESHPAMADHSAAAYNAGMDDAQTLTAIPSGPGRSPADESPAASLRRSEEDELPPAPAALPPELPASPPLPAAESPAFSPPAELPLSELAFTGCKAVPMTYAQLRRYEGRLEVWDAESETAWMVREPTSPTHEIPSHGLAGLAERIAAVRGSSIKCYGSMDLLMRDAQGEPRRIMQADQTVYLYPRRAELLGASAMVVGRHNYPDVVLEVDHTTDVRRGKLRLYESWGFPEVWVEVPEHRVASRPRGLVPGLTIHLLEGGVYRTSPESLAFPGWRAEAIHEAMNEAERSVRTNEILEGLGRVLGSREGTGPDDDALMRSLRGQSRAEGKAEGKVEGLAEGEKKGRTKGLAEGRRKGRAEGEARGQARMVRRMLLSRDIEVSEGFPLNVPGFGESSEAAIVAAAFACDSEQDFHARIRSGLDHDDDPMMDV